MIYKKSGSATDYKNFSELRAKCKNISKLEYQECMNQT